jgi:hypothetical protein
VLTADSGLPGAAHLVLADGVALLDPDRATWDAMLEGWERQQRVRFLKPATIHKRRRLVTRLVEFSNLYPWQWTAAEVEAFIDSLRSEPHRLAVSTARNYAVELRGFWST